MPQIEVMTVNAFTTADGRGGNPAGVVLNADHLTEKEMQDVAARVGLSETTFISKGHTGFHFDFFTPNRRISDCGHATVAGFSMLKHKNPALHKTTKEIESGNRRIVIQDEKVFMEQPLAALQGVPDVENVFEKLFDKATGFMNAKIAAHDVRFLLVELDGEEALQKLKPDLKAIQLYSEENDLVGVYVYARLDSSPFIATTRMFAPAYGINEESATGMAAGLLSAKLFQELRQVSFEIEQGKFMNPPSPSVIYCEVDPEGKRVIVGGDARLEDISQVSLV